MFKTVAAFATGDGGIMVFGIDPDELTVTGLDGEDPKSSGTACMAWCTAPWSRRRTSQSKTTRWTGRPSWCSTWHPDPRPHTGSPRTKAPGDKPEFYVRRGSSTYPAQPGELREAARTRPALNVNPGRRIPYGPW
jgi:hypothetical protein